MIRGTLSIITKVIVCVALTIPFAAHADTATSPARCQKVFTNSDTPAHSLEAYYTASETRRRLVNGYSEQPTLYDAGHDTQMLNDNAGEEAPALLADFLPADVAFIDHSLRDANGRQVVKDVGSGHFVALRGSVNVNGETIRTNVGVSSSALVSNEGQEQKYLVRPEAKAAIISIHGGGTATSGFHVPINLMNHFASYEVDVISIDWPWHGEGPRKAFNSEREVFEWLNQFIRKYVPDDVPVVIDGHSMGGLIADMINRLTDDPEFGLGQRIAGNIARSPVADPAPDKSLREKFAAEQAIAEARLNDEDVRARFAPVELTLGDDLIRGGKMHPDGYAHELFLEMHHRQTKPEHNGRLYKPMLTIIGIHDSLVFVGLEEQFRANQQLENITYYEMDERESVEGNVEKVGHLIGDYVVDGEVEQFVVMRQWLEEVLGIKLQKRNPKGQQRRDTLSTFIKLYSAQLAFREMVGSERATFARTGLDKASELNREFAELGEQLKDPRWKDFLKKRGNVMRKRNSLTPAALAEKLAALEKPEGYETLLAIEKRREDINQLRNLSFIPVGSPQADAVRANLKRTQQLTERNGQINKALKELEAKMKKLGSQRTKALALVKQREADVGGVYADLQAIDERQVQVLEIIAEQESLFGRIVTEFYVGLIEAGNFNAQTQVELPNNAIDARNRVYRLQLEYGELVAEYAQKVAEYGRSDDHADYREALLAYENLEAELVDLAAQVASLQSELYRNELEKWALKSTYVNELMPGYYQISEVPMAHILDAPTAEIDQHMGAIEAMIKEWRILWGLRSPLDDASSTSSGMY